jgi:hypothetical protein
MTKPNLWQRLAAHQWARERRYVFNIHRSVDALMWLLDGRWNYCMHMWIKCHLEERH